MSGAGPAHRARSPRHRAGSPPPGDPPQGPVTPPPAGRPGQRPEPSLGRSSRIMAIASATSRATGFLRSIVITAAIGLGAIGDAYSTANNLPNIVYELLIGGVLTSVIVPLLVHAQHHDEDGGEAYAQRLVSLAVLVLTAATVVAVIGAPLLTALYGINGDDTSKIALANLLARLLLPQMIFYGLGAMLGAILNTRAVYGPPAWAPVLNNIIVIATAGVFLIMPGPKTLDVNTITLAQVLVLGIGTTLGIVAQSVALIPAARRVGFRWKWRFDVRGVGLREAGTLSLWVIGYVIVSQLGYAVITRLANAAGDESGIGYAVYVQASLLFQTPYGIAGVALLTALLPRMSRAAAQGDTDRVVSDFSLGSRLNALALMPVTAAFIVLGPALTTVIFAYGNASFHSAHETGVVLAWAAFGLLPFAITMLQLRAFYAVKDARTPTLINAAMVVIRVILAVLVPVLLPARDVVTGLAVVNSLSFVIGAVIGEVLLRTRFGRLETRRMLRTTSRLAIASAIGGLAAWGVLVAVTGALGSGRLGSAMAVLGGSLLGGLIALIVGLRLHIEELAMAVGGVRRRIAR
ncbi:MAG TPA: murein biosynthesis integral membrane protein MurJ [Mycobacteriales bacterium]